MSGTNAVATLSSAFSEAKSGRQYHTEVELPLADASGPETDLLQRLTCKCGIEYRPLNRTRLFYGFPLYRKTEVKGKPKYLAVPTEEIQNMEGVADFIDQMATPATFVCQVVETAADAEVVELNPDEAGVIPLSAIFETAPGPEAPVDQHDASFGMQNVPEVVAEAVPTTLEPAPGHDIPGFDSMSKKDRKKALRAQQKAQEASA